MKDKENNKIGLDNYLKNILLSQKKNNYKSVLEMEIAYIDEIKDKSIEVGNQITVENNKNENPLFQGMIIKCEIKDEGYEKAASAKVVCHSMEWSFENAVISEYYENKKYTEVIEGLLDNYGIKLTSDDASPKKITALYLKRNLGDVINEILKEFTSNEKFLVLNDEKSAEIKDTPKTKYLNDSKEIKKLDDDHLKFLTSILFEEDVTEVVNSLVVSSEDEAQGDYKKVTLEASKSIADYGLKQDSFKGSVEEAKKILKGKSPVKRKMQLNFTNVTLNYKPFDVIKIEGYERKEINGAYEVSEVKDKLMAGGKVVKYNTTLILEAIIPESYKIISRL